MTKQQKALASAEQDAAYILEPIVDALLTNGLEGIQLLDAVTASAERILRASLTDQGLPVTVKGGVRLRTTTVQKEAQRIAKRLIDRLTVTNPATVPPVAARHGQPAAVAAAAA